MQHVAEPSYKERRRAQMIRFMGAAVATFVCARVAARGVAARRYVPTFIQPNHIPPPFSFHRDAVAAVTHLTLLATLGFAMAAMGVAWCWDILLLQEFGWRMKTVMGGAEAENELAGKPLDDLSREVTEALEGVLFGEDEE